MAILRSRFSIDGVDVDIDDVRWVTSEQKLHSAQGVRQVQIELPGMPGEIDVPGTHQHGAAEWSLTVAIVGRTYEELFMNKSAFEALLRSGSPSPLEITETLPSGTTLTAYARWNGAPSESPWDEQAYGGEHGVFMTYNFRIASGVWLGPPLTSTIPGAGQIGVVHDGALGGSAPMYETSIRVSGTNALLQLSAGDDPASYIRFEGNTNGLTTIWPKDAMSTYDASPIPINNSVQLHTGTRLFYIPASGRYRVDFRSGATVATITTRRAFF